MTYRLPIFAALLIPTFLIGCGSGEVPLTNLSGTANFAGKPIVFGQVEFVPDAAKQHTGPAGSAVISNGTFSTAETGTGISPGPHLVRITAYENVPPAASEDETAVVDGPPPLFVGYTVEMDLQNSELNIDVPEDAKGFNLYATQKTKRNANEP